MEGNEQLDPSTGRSPACLLYTSFLSKEIAAAGGDPARETMQVIQTKDGKSFYSDAEGGAWRVYPFIEDTVCLQAAETPELDVYKRQGSTLLPDLEPGKSASVTLKLRALPEISSANQSIQTELKYCLLYTSHFPGQTSGGQQQRAGIARAFIARPDVVFADEPTGNLDSKTTVEIMEMICGFARTYHQTSVLVTHDPEMASYADRVVHLIDGAIVGDEIQKRR